MPVLNDFRAGITPAGAGKTKTHQTAFPSARDHPRRCGENSLNSSSCRSRSGSPPQVRGKRARHLVTYLHDGITPAGAGKTIMMIHDIIKIKDHPRRCGENRCIHWYDWDDIGSPPQVRGKPAADYRRYHQRRITPAGAGKTRGDKKCRIANRDHPRRCGENESLENQSVLLIGSPPQVRGKLPSIICGNASTRITPAGAGKTKGKRGDTHYKQDHPRRCGEN